MPHNKNLRWQGKAGELGSRGQAKILDLQIAVPLGVEVNKNNAYHVMYPTNPGHLYCTTR